MNRKTSATGGRRNERLPTKVSRPHWWGRVPAQAGWQSGWHSGRACVSPAPTNGRRRNSSRARAAPERQGLKFDAG